MIAWLRRFSPRYRRYVKIKEDRIKRDLIIAFRRMEILTSAEPDFRTRLRMRRDLMKTRIALMIKGITV